MLGILLSYRIGHPIFFFQASIAPRTLYPLRLCTRYTRLLMLLPSSIDKDRRGKAVGNHNDHAARPLNFATIFSPLVWHYESESMN